MDDEKARAAIVEELTKWIHYMAYSLVDMQDICPSKVRVSVWVGPGMLEVETVFDEKKFKESVEDMIRREVLEQAKKAHKE